ncbi:putative phage abortive infection protein [Paenibacillus sp. ALJ109b]|uniref:putative phage abortive infection protein n=1 Tax=Paenibacillus sp. ALJ109b TaxID=2709068 RepID=UPI0013D452EE|nr:putative phage abortive infection protein [Paenibacillus sp. ALJ109b]NEU62840.1 hypothetical protein [Paenibacillus sp. ALJ109b]
MNRLKSSVRKFMLEDLDSIKKQDKPNVIVNFKAILLGFLVIWCLSGVIIYYAFSDWSDRGTFGDMFGAINALFSAFAFGGLVYTLFIQRYELSLQRKELEMQRLEVARNGDQLEQQKNVMIQQSFENTFFKMIELHHNLIASMNDKPYEGRRAIEKLREFLYDELKRANHKRDLNKTIEDFLSLKGRHIKHYLNNYYCILELIEQHGLNTEEDLRDSNYTRIALSQLSEDERFLIFYTLGYKSETRLFLEKFTDISELNHFARHHYEWMTS